MASNQPNPEIPDLPVLDAPLGKMFEAMGNSAAIQQPEQTPGVDHDPHAAMIATTGLGHAAPSARTRRRRIETARASIAREFGAPDQRVRENVADTITEVKSKWGGYSASTNPHRPQTFRERRMAKRLELVAEKKRLVGTKIARHRIANGASPEYGGGKPGGHGKVNPYPLPISTESMNRKERKQIKKSRQQERKLTKRFNKLDVKFNKIAGL